jgi:hypothetical protein
MTDDPITLFISLICIILGIILFFKIWGMTNNVKKIREIMEKRNEEK